MRRSYRAKASIQAKEKQTKPTAFFSASQERGMDTGHDPFFQVGGNSIAADGNVMISKKGKEDEKQVGSEVQQQGNMTKAAAEEKDDKGKTQVQKKPEGNEKEKKDKVPVQKKETGDKKKEKDEVAVQKKTHDAEKEEEDKTIVNKKDNAQGGSATVAGSPVETAITNKKGRGEQLAGPVLADMETAFDNDFSDVRIHTDNEAASLSNELGAQAFTTGKDIYFNSGNFDPLSAKGQHLLAHELTHVVQQNKDTIRKKPEDKKGASKAAAPVPAKDKKDPEQTRAQDVRDHYHKALKNKSVDWREVAMYFNAFSLPEMQKEMGMLSAGQLFQLHQGAVYGAGVGPWSAAALHTTPVPGLDSAVAATIDEKILHENYQVAIDLMVDELDKRGIIDRKLLWGGTFHYLEKANMKGEGRVLAPGFDKAGNANPTATNLGSDTFGEGKGLPFLFSTIIHEYQHVQQMQKQSEAKSQVPGQSDNEATHLQQEVEAYATELIRAKETGLYNNAEQMEDTWNRLEHKWEQLTDSQKQAVKDLYKKAYSIVKEALGKKAFLVYTPAK